VKISWLFTGSEPDAAVFLFNIEQILHVAELAVFYGYCFFNYQTILTHSRSRVVLHLLKAAAASNKWFKVYVTESLPDRAGSALLLYLLCTFDTNLFYCSVVLASWQFWVAAVLKFLNYTGVWENV